MDRFYPLHAAIFDELERQGCMVADTVALAQAVLHSLQEKEVVSVRHYANPRCANGACDE